MQTLINSISRSVQRREAESWRRYAILLAQGDDAPAGAADELTELMRDLRLSVDDVRQHAAALVEARRLAELAAQRDELKALADEAQGKWAELNRDLPAKVRELEAEESRARGEAQTAQAELYKAREAATKLQDFSVKNAWMLDGVPIVTVQADRLPAALDRRLLALDPVGIYTAAQLDTLGLTQADLNLLPRLPGAGESRYFGAVVLAWAKSVDASLRARHREELQDQLVNVPKGLLDLVPAQRYAVGELAAMGFPSERVRTGKEYIPRAHADAYRGQDVIDWALMATARNDRVRQELAVLDGEKPEPAAEVATEPIVAAEPPAPEPPMAQEPPSAVAAPTETGPDLSEAAPATARTSRRR